MNNNDGRPGGRVGDKVMGRVDVAQLLDVSVGAVDRYCRDKKHPLPCRKVRGRVRFWESEVLKWFEEEAGGGGTGRGGARD